MNQPSPPRSPSGRKSYTPNHPHSLDSRNGFPARVGTARVFWHAAGARHSALALPGFSGMRRFLASHFWHCQGFLASRGSPPPNSGTARDSWHAAGARHSALALPGIPGTRRFLATQLWHCQGFLASRGPSPPSSGTARVSWHAAGSRIPSPHPLTFSASSFLLHIPVSDWHVTDLAIASIIVAMQDRR